MRVNLKQGQINTYINCNMNVNGNGYFWVPTPVTDTVMSFLCYSCVVNAVLTYHTFQTFSLRLWLFLYP